MRDVVVEIASRKFGIPFECPCCGSPPDGELAIGLARTARLHSADSARAIDFPYCNRCRDHATRWDAAAMTATAVTVVGIAVALMLAALGRWWVGAIAFVVAVPVAVGLARRGRARAAAACLPSCAAHSIAVAYLGWRNGASAFAFASPSYTARFAEANAGARVHDSAALSKLLAAYHLARQQVPSQAVTTIPPPLTAREWITRIEAASGPATRRNTFTKAVDAVHDALERREIVQAAARAELADVLDRVAKAPAKLRMRWLERAIDEVRRDNIPDELQDAELEMLDARRVELEKT